jgi:hypothetical protein
MFVACEFWFFIFFSSSFPVDFSLPVVLFGTFVTQLGAAPDRGTRPQIAMESYFFVRNLSICEEEGIDGILGECPVINCAQRVMGQKIWQQCAAVLLPAANNPPGAQASARKQLGNARRALGYINRSSSGTDCEG